VVCNAVRLVRQSARLVAVTHAQKMLNVPGKNGENAVQTAPSVVLTTTFSGPGSGFRSKQPSTVVRSARTTHQHTSLLKRRVTSPVALFLAKVTGVSSTNAPQRLQFHQATFVAEVQKPESSSSLKRPSMVVKSAATHMERRTPRTAATVHAKFLALGLGMTGASAAPRAVVDLCRVHSKSHKSHSMVVPTALTPMATQRLRHVEMTRAQLTAKVHGAPGPNALKRALTAKAMVRLVRQRASSLSQSKLRMVANNASTLITRLKRRSAMTSAAQWIVLDHGASLVPAHPLVEMESRDAPISLHSQLCMVVWNAPAAMNQPTLVLATLVHAPSIVKANGQPGPTVPRSAVVVRRHHGSW
jgi:hypothetical protein